MIEVERKVEITREFVAFVTEKGVYEGGKTIEDIYFDTTDYRYTSKNIWLRKRGDQFELKRVIGGGKSASDRYEEIADSEAILDALNIESNGEFISSLHEAEIVPFARVVTRRQKYRFPHFHVDLDEAHFEGMIYRIAEVECMVEGEDQISEAEQIIKEFLNRFQIDSTQKPQAKLSVYLQRCAPDHFKMLQSVGVI